MSERIPTISLSWLWVLAALFAPCGCRSAEVSGDLAGMSPKVVRSAARYQFEYVLGPSDQLDVVVLNHPIASRSVIVRPDGRISLPMLDDVQAAGLTISELDASLTERLAARLLEPEVTVIATSVRPAKVYVFGEVERPGAIPLAQVDTAAQAVIAAGGFKLSAYTERIVLLRLDGDGTLTATTVPVDLTGQPAPYMMLHNIPLRADDMVFVPKTKIAQVGDWLDQFLNKPLQSVNMVISSYASLRIIELAKSNN